ncbi:hypothetical protein EDB87DRAFT_1689495 [Lactarius vividus]|nr:hypothetical protein EDB87DRAFT_1689495 [Lactarius vividus]
MNVNEDKDEGDEIGPGCYILDLGTPDLRRSKLWIRKEYIRLYEYCNKYLESRRTEQVAPSVVITGQPGIGKSYWIIYAMCRCLADGKPVIWFRSGIHKDGVPDYLAAHDTNHLIILSSCPPSDQWKCLTETTRWSIAIMNPWTREEISQAAVIYGLTANDPRIDEMYNQYGPTPRICLDFVRDGAMFIVERTPSQMPPTLLMKRVPRKDLIRANLNVSNGMEFIYESSEPITHAIKAELWNRLQEETRAARIALYKRLENVEGMRKIAGLVLESLA